MIENLPGPLTARHSALRVAFVGDQGLPWLGQAVDSRLVDPKDLAEAMQTIEDWAQLLIVDHNPGGRWSGRLTTVLSGARDADVPVVGIAGRGVGAADGFSVLQVGSRIAPGVDVVGPALDPLVHRPRALSSPQDATGILAVEQPPLRGPEAMRKLLRPWLPRAGAVVLPWVAEPGFDDGVWTVGSGSTIDADHGSVVIVTEDGHASAWSRATHIAETVAGGMPVITTGTADSGLDGLLPATLIASSGTPLSYLQTPEARERLGVLQRREALRELASWAHWDRLRALLHLPVPPLPSVSVLLPTLRREFLAGALAHVEQQTYPRLDLVLVLHGDEWPDSLPEVDALEMPVSVVRVGGSVSFGDALNEGTLAARGDFLAKMDDDDWYSREHIWDLVLAYEHAEADIVGKAAEWLYLAELDITVRRLADGAEWPSRTIAGGTLLMLRDDLRRVGGWRSVGRSVDQELIGAIHDAGGSSFRTHGYGYVLHRHDDGHTWSIDSDYFLRDTSVQYRGLRLDVAMVGDIEGSES